MSQTVTQTRQKAYKPVPKAKRTPGRPSDYLPEMIAEAEELCQSGATDQELASHFDISVGTLYRWKNEHPQFREAIARGKKAIDDRVERSLFSRAVGFTFKSEKVFCNADGVHRVPTLEYLPPDPAAAKHWLGVRRRDEWADVQRIDLNGSLQVEDAGSRDLALALIGILRTAGSDEGEPVTIDHQPVQSAPATVSVAQERRRRAFE